MNAISPLQFGIFLFGTYILLSFILALKGMKKTKSLKSFALGQSDMSPFLVGITLAASIASTATFVINPGFVYSHGISALLHFSVAGLLGMVLALWLFSKKFRHLGLKNNAITLPHWIGAIYKDRKMRLFFSLLNLALSLTFIVLILKGSALVLKFSFGLSYFSALSIIVATVFSYILMGGTYATHIPTPFKVF